MSVNFRGIVIVASALLLGACSYSQLTPQQETDFSAIELSAAMEGRWRIVALGSLQLSEVPPVSVVFTEDGLIAGNTGCNSYRSTYRLAGFGNISVDPIATTRRICGDPIMNRERRLLNVLSRIESLNLNSDNTVLTLSTGESSETLYLHRD